jgi:hypothetical protein
MSLDPDPKTRIPSNFWIESAPVLNFAVAEIPSLKSLGRRRASEKLVEKYRQKKIKSVIHFRRVMDAYELSEEDKSLRTQVLRRVEEYFLKPELETRAAFDDFTAEHKRAQSALTLCTDFEQRLSKLKVRVISDDSERKKLVRAMKKVVGLCEALIDSLQGSDDPDISRE